MVSGWALEPTRKLLNRYTSTRKDSATGNQPIHDHFLVNLKTFQWMIIQVF